MTQASPQSSLSPSRLAGLLARFYPTPDAGLAPDSIAALARLIDLSGSIAVASAQVRRGPPPGAEPPQASLLRRDHDRARASLQDSVTESFQPSGGPSRLRWPEQDEGGEGAVFGRFYRIHQRAFDARLRNLHESVRGRVADSPQLAGLAELDRVFGELLAGQVRDSFAILPGLVTARARRSGVGDGDEQKDPAVALDPMGLREDVRALLMAEIDARLLPTLGLIEALEENQHKP